MRKQYDNCDYGTPSVPRCPAHVAGCAVPKYPVRYRLLGRGDRWRTTRRVWWPALLHEPAQPGRKDHHGVPSEHPETSAWFRPGTRDLLVFDRGGVSESDPRIRAPPGRLGL